MTTQQQKPTSIFPDMPRDNTIADKDGEMTSYWQLYHQQNTNALQQNFSNEGLKLPLLTASEISDIQGIYTPLIGSPLPQNAGSQDFIPDISGAMVFDSTNRVPKVFIITFDSSTPPNILTAAWKTYTLT